MATRVPWNGWLFAGLPALLVARPALGQDREVNVGISYSHLFWSGENANELEERGGVRMDVRFTLP